MIGCMMIQFWVEQIFDTGIEMSGQFEGQLKRRVVSLAFDGVDRLAGDPNGRCEISLAQVRALASFGEVVTHYR